MTLAIGAVTLGTPVVLAPMAGVTNPPFRRLCREAGRAGLPGDDVAPRPPYAAAGLYVSEMVTSRALVERTPETMRMVTPDPTDPVRSVQLYGVDPDTVAAAVGILVREDLADHVDLNFGCPVPKVTRKGGGAALPWKRDLFADLVGAVVGAASRAGRGIGRDVPVTVKMRIGIDDDHETFLDAARLAQGAGVAAVALHARTQVQHYAGHAHWERIAELKDALRIPVFGNGDVFSGEDARAMMECTGCDAVVVGRGCQGRPWLFREVVRALHGEPRVAGPTLGEVGDAGRVGACHRCPPFWWVSSRRANHPGPPHRGGSRAR